MKDSFKSLDYFVTQAVPLIASGFLVLTAISFLSGRMPDGIPAFPTLCVLSAFAYPIGLALRELACILGLVASQPEDLLVDSANHSMPNKRWNITFHKLYQKVSGREWVWPPASAYDEGLSGLRSETIGESTSDERVLHRMNAAAHSSAIFGPSCLVAGFILLIRGLARLDPGALSFAFLALLIGTVLVATSWVTLGRGVAFAVKDVSFEPQVPPRPVPVQAVDATASGGGSTDSGSGQTAPGSESTQEHTVADSYENF